MSLELDSRFVKRGYWVNLSKGPTMGQTITTDSKTGSVVVALLAVLASLGMTHLWHLLTFIYYQIRANGRPSEGLFRHQQALLRTLPTPSSLMADSVKLWLAWRGASDRALTSCLTYIITGLVFAMGSLAVSIFSSTMVSTSNIEVLVESPHCGLFIGGAGSNGYFSPVTAASYSYASDCYRTGSLPSQCNTLLRPNVPFATRFTQCPFDASICASPAVSFDSGLIDLNDAFGLNLDEADRIRYRRKTTCAILSLDGYTKVRNGRPADSGALGRELFPGEEVIDYMYGTFTRVGAPLSQSLVNSNISETYRSLGTYVLDGMEDQIFSPVPQLEISNADLTIRLTINGKILYEHPVNDPLFSAHRPINMTVQTGYRTLYKSDFPGSALACAEQFQYCLKSNICSKLGGRVAVLDPPMTPPAANEVQLAVLQLLLVATKPQILVDTDQYKAQEQLSGGRVVSLPDDQWIKELTSWESSVWATYQITVADYAIGPIVRDPLSKNFTKPPSNQAEKRLCGMQKMRKPGGFVNINFFGLVFTITVSATIVLIDVVLLRSLFYLRKYAKWLGPRVDRWLQDGIYQLQRRAHEAQGNSIWKNLTDEVPIISDKTLLPDLPIETLPVPGTPTPMVQTQSAQQQCNSAPTGDATSTQSVPEASTVSATTPPQFETTPSGAAVANSLPES